MKYKILTGSQECMLNYKARVRFGVRVWYGGTLIPKKYGYGYGGIFFYYIFLYIIMHIFLNICELKNKYE